MEKNMKDSEERVGHDALRTGAVPTGINKRYFAMS
jgi:hypothetical protein